MIAEVGKMGLQGLTVGMTCEDQELVTPEISAEHVGSGALRVYATPAMALFIERVCRSMVDPLLPETQVTVGVHLDLHHRAPTPVGDRVRLKARIIALEGQSISFETEIRDSHEVVGHALHKRVVIDVDRFLKRVREKADQLEDEA